MKEQKQFFVLDPRTKLLLVFVEAFFVLAVTGGDRLYWFRILFAVLPFLLLMATGRYQTFAIGVLVFALTEYMQKYIFPGLHGAAAVIMMVLILLISRFLPAFLMGSYVIRTTKVSEFKAAMERMHMPDELTIPMCVMFRFFPTVREECASIWAAMKMRGIGIGGSKGYEMLEYIMVPMLSCSAKIGDELSASALTRGLGISKVRTNICHIGFHAADYMVFALVIAGCVYWISGVIL